MVINEPEKSERDGIAPSALTRGPTDGLAPLFFYGFLLRRHIWFIAVCTIASAIVVAVLVKLLVRPTYQAIATIKIVQQQNPNSELATMLEPMSRPLVSTGGSLLRNSDVARAMEFKSIMESYAFTGAMVERYKLAKLIDPGSRLSLSHYKRTSRQWALYKAMRSRFGYNYDSYASMIHLSFVANSPADAEMVLGLYLKSLRDRLRKEMVRNAGTAFNSLIAAARASSDAELQTQLYMRAAAQEQAEKLAQSQADFAFAVIEPPVAPDHHYRPQTTKDGLIAGIIALILSAGWVTVLAPTWRDYRRYEAELINRYEAELNGNSTRATHPGQKVERPSGARGASGVER